MPSPPYPLATRWARLPLSEDKFHVRLQGVEELVLVKMAAMMLVEPWYMDIKKIWVGRGMCSWSCGLWLGMGWEERWGCAVNRCRTRRTMS